MLQAVDGETLQIVGRRVDRPMGWGLCDLRIGAVLARTAIERGLPGIEAAHAAIDVLERKAVHRGGHQGYAHGLHLPHVILGIGEIRDRAGVPVRRAGFRSHHKAGRVIRPLHGAVGKIVAIEETNLIPAVTALIQFGREDLHDRIPHKLSQVTGADVAFHRIGVNPVKNARIGGHADMVTGHSKCQLIRVFIGWKKFCHAQIRKRLGCIAGFILLRLKLGIIIRRFRNRLLFVRHSILLCIRRFRFRPLYRLCASDDEQGHHADIRHALACGDVLDLDNLLIQQKMRIQVTRLHIAADHFTGIVQKPDFNRSGFHEFRGQNPYDIVHGGVEQIVLGHRRVAVHAGLTDGSGVHIPPLKDYRLDGKRIAAVHFPVSFSHPASIRILDGWLVGKRFLCGIVLRSIGRHIVRRLFCGFLLTSRGGIRKLGVAARRIGHFRGLRAGNPAFFFGFRRSGRKRRVRQCFTGCGDQISRRSGFCPRTPRHTAEGHAHRQQKRRQAFDSLFQLHRVPPS